MINHRPHRRIALTALGMLVLFACSDDPAGLDNESTPRLMQVIPHGDSDDVPVGTSIEMSFDGPLQSGMESLMALHMGGLDGPEVSGTWTRGVGPSGWMTMTFTPSDPLHHSTEYAIHLGGGMSDDDGHTVALDNHGPGMGGRWVTEAMMSGDPMGPSTHTGDHMGTGWQHSNGSYGMAFFFTTG